MRCKTSTFSHKPDEKEESKKERIGFVINQPLPSRQSQTTPMNEGETVINERGGKQSFVKAMFSAIPPISLKLLAECLGFGARLYGFDNWKSISIEENLCHALNHINEWRLGDRSEPHLVNAMARISFAVWQAVDQGEQPPTYIHPKDRQSGQT